MKFRLNSALAASTLLIVTGAAFAASDAPQATNPAARAGATASSAMTAGEVRKVDAEQSKVTIKHEAIANLEMPPMTMVFRASKPEMLKDLKVGDKITFAAESQAGAIVLTQIQPVK